MKQKYMKYLEKFMNTKQLVIILLIGVGLLFLPGLFQAERTKPTVKENTADFYDRRSYEKELESRLADILSTVRGISRVSVMITLENSGEMYFARNETANEKKITDSSLDEKTQQSESSTALKGESGGKQTPILLKTGAPEIAGVLVTARGADAPAIQKSITEAVRAVLNVPVHRIQVLSKE